jgi:hypothetical protein
MSTGSMITVENGQTLSDLFHKFIRMTVKTDDRDKRFQKKRHSLSKSQQQQSLIPPNSKRSQRVLIQPASRLPPRQHKQNSTVAYYNVSPITTDNNSYSHTDNDEQESYQIHHVRFKRLTFLFLFINLKMLLKFEM